MRTAAPADIPAIAPAPIFLFLGAGVVTDRVAEDEGGVEVSIPVALGDVIFLLLVEGCGTGVDGEDVEVTLEGRVVETQSSTAPGCITNASELTDCPAWSCILTKTWVKAGRFDAQSKEFPVRPENCSRVARLPL